MRALTAAAVVGEDHTLTVQVPPDIPSGVHQVVIVINSSPSPPASTVKVWQLPVHDTGLVDPSMTFRREDMYGDDGR